MFLMIFNNEINDKFISQAKEIINTGISNPFGIDYVYFIYNDILSIVIRSYFDNGIISYEVYNIDVKTGKSISNEEILKVEGLTKSEFDYL